MFDKNKKEKEIELPVRKFFAIRKLPGHPQDYWPCYQIEVVTVQGAEVLNVELYDKPDTLQMILSKAQLFLDPNNEVFDENLEPTDYSA